MHSLSNLPRATLLLEYAYYDGTGVIDHLTRFLNQLGYRAVTRKAPTGRLVTTRDTRRLLKDWLQDLPAYPLHRAPTPDDYRHMKVQIIAHYDHSEMLS